MCTVVGKALALALASYYHIQQHGMSSSYQRNFGAAYGIRIIFPLHFNTSIHFGCDFDRHFIHVLAEGLWLRLHIDSLQPFILQGTAVSRHVLFWSEVCCSLHPKMGVYFAIRAVKNDGTWNWSAVELRPDRCSENKSRNQSRQQFLNMQASRLRILLQSMSFCLWPQSGSDTGRALWSDTWISLFGVCGGGCRGEGL